MWTTPGFLHFQGFETIVSAAVGVVVS